MIFSTKNLFVLMLLFSIYTLTGCVMLASENSPSSSVPNGEIITFINTPNELMHDEDEIHENEKSIGRKERDNSDTEKAYEESVLNAGVNKDTSVEDDNIDYLLDSLQPAIMINGEVFILFSFDYKFSSNLDETEIDGRITSNVSLSEWPTIDNQTNFDILLDARYIIYGEDIALFWNYNNFQKWVLFRNIRFFD